MPRILELFLLAVTFPLWGLLLLILMGVLAVTHRPVFFIQTRPGLNGRPFRLIKFRTMRAGKEPEAVRITRLGRWLRASSLDELPELLNVLRGDMALVGPRPLLMAYLCEYSPEEHRRHNVRPGITGWAQVHGRNRLTRQEKIRYDLDYVARRSTALDFKILFLTLFHLRGN